MGNAGRHLAYRGEPLAQARVALEPLDVGDVLERKQHAGIAARRIEMRRGQAQLDLAGVGGSIRGLDAPAAPHAGRGVQVGRHSRRKIQHILDAPSDHR